MSDTTFGCEHDWDSFLFAQATTSARDVSRRECLKCGQVEELFSIGDSATSNYAAWMKTNSARDDRSATE